jgi:transcription elongation factor Elf1
MATKTKKEMMMSHHAALLDVGDAMCEISCLRLLREENGHVNIFKMVDIQSEWVDNQEEGADTIKKHNTNRTHKVAGKIMLKG